MSDAALKRFFSSLAAALIAGSILSSCGGSLHTPPTVAAAPTSGSTATTNPVVTDAPSAATGLETNADIGIDGAAKRALSELSGYPVEEDPRPPNVVGIVSGTPADYEKIAGMAVGSATDRQTIGKSYIVVVTGWFRVTAPLSGDGPNPFPAAVVYLDAETGDLLNLSLMRDVPVLTAYDVQVPAATS